MRVTVDHMCVVVPISKLDDIVKFLLAALAPLNFKEIMRPIPTSVGLGDQLPFFWVSGVEGDAATLERVMQSEHMAFSVASNELVDKFYEAAIKSGGKDNGAPGPRPQYHPGYYAAFVRDPVCGINFEVVNHNM
ncbi:hypothetical protein Q7P37_006985 [Cladosporium fusiforme]